MCNLRYHHNGTATLIVLTAAIYTNSVSRALRVSDELEAGTVTVNSAILPNVYSPFGGFKESGVGRENGWQGLLGYLEVKSVLIKYVNMLCHAYRSYQLTQSSMAI